MFTSKKLEEMLDVVEHLNRKNTEEQSLMRLNYDQIVEDQQTEISSLKDQLLKAQLLQNRMSVNQSAIQIQQSRLSAKNLQNSGMMKSEPKSSLMSSEIDREELNDQVHSLKRSAISDLGGMDENDAFEGTLEKNWDVNKLIMAFEIERVMMQRDEGY